MTRIQTLSDLQPGQSATVRSVCAPGGMQRRLNLACALVGDVKLLLLDEPTVGADENSIEIILNTITALKNGGCAVLLVSHRAEDIARVCDRAVKLKDGVVEDGSR